MWVSQNIWENNEKMIRLTIVFKLNWVGRSDGNIKCWLSHVIARSNFCNKRRRIDILLIIEIFVSWNVTDNSLIFIKPINNYDY